MDLLFDHIPKISRALSGGSLINTILLTVRLWYFALTRKLTGLHSKFKVTGRYNNHPVIFHLLLFLDLAVLHEVFVDEEYEWCPIDNPKVIIDLGAHFGDTALYYHARFPEAKIIAVEPAPESYARLVEHTANIPQIITVQAAVGASDGVVKLNLMPSSLGHSVSERIDSTGQVEVRQVTLGTLFADQGIEKADLIKFDIEGAEFDLFKTSNQKKYSLAYIGEVHYDLSKLKNYHIREAFPGFNYEEMQLVNKNRFLIKAKDSSIDI